MGDSSQAADNDAFADFYRSNFASVRCFLMRTGAARDEAEDATQSAMLTLLRRWPDVSQRRAWVRVVARNNWLRTKRDERFVVCLEPPTWEGPEEGPAWGLVGETISAMRHLPQAQREIIALVADGYAPAEIADMTGKSSSVVRSNLAHARRRLREKLGPART
jgi:DNA-directed RNA polymerase specialized sigma24 family protein